MPRRCYNGKCNTIARPLSKYAAESDFGHSSCLARAPSVLVGRLGERATNAVSTAGDEDGVPGQLHVFSGAEIRAIGWIRRGPRVAVPLRTTVENWW